MKFDEWINSRVGKYIDYDGVYGVQCVDLADDYIVNCLGLKLGFYCDYAKEWWNNRNQSKWLKDNFDFYNAQDIVPKKGDIGVRTTGKYGHIFVIGKSYGNIIVMYDENHSGNHDKVTMRTIPNEPSYITGILRPKNREMIDMWGTHIVQSNCDVFSKSDLTNKIGELYKGDEVKNLGTANGHNMVVYPVGKYYKVGVIKKGNIK